MLKPMSRVEGKLRFCPLDKCSHYSVATKYPRKCYYELQCWRGYLDTIIALFRLRVRDESNKQAGSAGEDKERTKEVIVCTNDVVYKRLKGRVSESQNTKRRSK